MKLQSILLLTGLAAGITTVSCKSTADEVEEFYGRSAPNRAEAEARDAANIDYDFYNHVFAHIDRRLNEFNEKEEAKLPVFSSKDVQDAFRDLSFIRNAEDISLISMDFAGPADVDYKFLVDRESRTLTRTIGDKEETYTFETFTNGVPPAIPYDAHILYAFATNFSRIAETVDIRSYQKLEHGENPAIADLENEANLDEKGNKKDKNKPEIKTKTTIEPLEFRIDNRWCKCYDVKLKKVCAPAVAMALYISDEEKTISRIDIIMDDDSKTSYIMDWRDQDGIVLPRVIQRLGDNAVFFRDDAKVIRKSVRAMEEAEAAAEAAAAAADEDEDNEPETVEIDASADNNSEEEDASGEEEEENTEEEEDIF